VFVFYNSNQAVFYTRALTPLSISSDEQAIRNIDLRSGAAVIITSNRHNNGLTSEPVLPGQQIGIDLDYRIQAPYYTLFGDHQIVVGIENSPQMSHIIGTPGTYPGVSGTAELSITAPDSAGHYTVYAARIDMSDTSQENLFREYRRAFADVDIFHIPLGQLTVLAASATVQGVIYRDNRIPAPNTHISAERMNSRDYSILSGRERDWVPRYHSACGQVPGLSCGINTSSGNTR